MTSVNDNIDNRRINTGVTNSTVSIVDTHGIYLTKIHLLISINPTGWRFPQYIFWMPNVIDHTMISSEAMDFSTRGMRNKLSKHLWQNVINNVKCSEPYNITDIIPNVDIGSFIGNKKSLWNWM